MSTDLYIYYRVREENAAHFLSKAIGMQKALQHTHGIQASLKRRPHAEDGWHTWMEIYLATPADFEQAIAAAVTTHGLASAIEGRRHVEHFVDATSCA
ncbi:MAG: DUF4936 family protein [Oxalicibacterium faecigallinarum]|uniref:DUF4936 family protein n=1 Tax=Oxalicibacterium faecigallinarum TaxID=573741 RepID=UPI0028076E44|nr:DUF4936 family protein [Oxalicibacterium faecigallinarum]MDQ7968633.1 DUF4936 family protein [Oxalicibacterium faecigallinarum]